MSEYVEGTVRLKRWKSYLSDGASSVEYTPSTKGTVAVGVILGYEPLKIDDDLSGLVDVEDEILRLADEIKATRKRRAKSRREGVAP